MAKLYARKSDGTYVPYNPQSVTNIDVVQTTGNSVTAAMSQDAVTKELATKQNTLTDTDGSYGQRVAELENGKQDALTAGNGISIEGNVISASVAEVVDKIVNAGYLFAGVATPSTNPGTPEAKVFYIANGKGTYSNFGSLEVTEDEVVVLKYDTAWHKVATGIASDEKLSELEIEKITINKVLELNNANVVAYDDTIPFAASYIPFEIAKGEVLFVEYSNHTIGNEVAIALGTNKGGTQYLINDKEGTKTNGSFVGVAEGTTGYIRFYSEDTTTHVKVVVFREQSLRLNEIEHQIAYKEIASSVPTIQGKLLNADGTLAGGSSAWGTSEFIAVHSGDTFKLTASQYAPSPYVALQVYNSSKDVVKNYIAGADIFADEAFNLNVMEDGYIRICYRISSGYTIAFLKLLSIDNRLSLLESSGQTKRINKNINFVGMSIWWYDGRTLAEGHMGGEVARGYQTLLKEQFDFLSDTGTIYCYSGESLGATSASDTSCIMNHSSSWVTSPNAIWTLDSITNDFKRNIPIGSYSDYVNKTGLLTYYGALREFKDKVAELSGADAIVICANSLRRNNSGYTSTSQNTQGHTLTSYEHALMDIASREHWYFVDQFRLCGVTDDSIDLTTIDGLHLNNFGYTLAVKPWVEQFAIIHRALQ